MALPPHHCNFLVPLRWTEGRGVRRYVRNKLVLRSRVSRLWKVRPKWKPPFRLFSVCRRRLRVINCTRTRSPLTWKGLRDRRRGRTNFGLGCPSFRFLVALRVRVVNGLREGLVRRPLIRMRGRRMNRKRKVPRLALEFRRKSRKSTRRKPVRLLRVRTTCVHVFRVPNLPSSLGNVLSVLLLFVFITMFVVVDRRNMRWGRRVWFSLLVR